MTFRGRPSKLRTIRKAQESEGKMGQIAEDMIDGTCCSWCGMYFEDKANPDKLPSHGYPVVCKDCGKDYSDEKLEQDGLGRATYPTM